MVGGSLRILRLPPQLKLVAMILLKVALKHKKSKSKINQHRVVKMTPSPEHQQITVSGEPCFTCNAPSLRLSCRNIFPTII
jgi:hypothetical protein